MSDFRTLIFICFKIKSIFFVNFFLVINPKFHPKYPSLSFLEPSKSNLQNGVAISPSVGSHNIHLLNEEKLHHSQFRGNIFFPFSLKKIAPSFHQLF
ncbi:MAG: hypothetical protein Ct9H90mP22_2920 [Gammaproteobacteria bacterium]|nr:MAG: hypothetical protein Ct9H90mP22_2920 [Gammaproteobacteria bacterium]